MAINDDTFEWMLKRNLMLNDVSELRLRKISNFFRDVVLPDIGKELQITNFAQLTSRKAKLAKLRSVINRTIPFDEFKADAMKYYTESANREAQAFSAWMTEQLPLRMEMVVPAPNLIDAVINEKPFDGQIMSGWFDKLEKPIQDGIYRDFRSGFIQGKTIPEMAKFVREKNIGAFAVGGTKKAIRDSKAVVRTGSTMVTNRAREVTYEMNNDIIKGVRYVATLDDRTTVECASLHGKVFPIGEGPRPPIHWQCRSTTVPEVMSWEEMGLPGRELSGKQMARFNGKPARGFEKDFGAFVDTMTEAQQNKFLGAVRAQMWRDGTVTDLSQFMASTTRMKLLSEFGLNRAGNAFGAVAKSAPKTTFAGWDKVHPDDYTTRELDRRYKRDVLEDISKQNDISPLVVKNELDKAVQGALKDAEVRCRIDDYDLVSALNDGRFRSQFETGTSKGMLDNGRRSGLEELIFSYPERMEAYKRPIYGYVHGDKIDNSFRRLDQYGRNKVVMKKSIRNRTTVTGGDSLDNEGLCKPMPIDKAGGETIVRLDTNYIFDDKDRVLTTPNYWEAQMHGGVPIEDIERVILNPNFDGMDAIQKLLDEKKIPWEVGEGGEVWL